jgi:hypothetical protein
MKKGGNKKSFFMSLPFHFIDGRAHECELQWSCNLLHFILASRDKLFNLKFFPNYVSTFDA